MQMNFAKSLSGAIALSLAVVTSANAALPTEATDAITAIGTDGLALQAAVWVPLGLVTVGFIVMKLFKRGSNKI
jgi:hypothetical protein